MNGDQAAGDVWGAMAALATQSDGERCWRLLEELRSDFYASVTLMCDNEDGPPNNAIEVCAEWTGWATKRFSGESVYECLEAAAAQRAVVLAAAEVAAP